MTSIEDLESRVRLLEAAGRGEVIGLRNDLEAMRHETRHTLNSLMLASGNHSAKLSDVNTKTDMLMEMVAELRRLYIARGNNESTE